LYVCVCMAVTDRQIREAAAAGARNLKDLRRDLGVTSECGSCATHARRCLAEANESQRKAAKPKRLPEMEIPISDSRHPRGSGEPPFGPL